MSASEVQIRVRRALLYDLKGMLDIDQAIRDSGAPLTYEGFTTRYIFGLNTTEIDSARRASLLEEAVKLLDLSFVAESEGRVCGFVVGRRIYIVERDVNIGEIAIISVHPEYQRKGVAAKLVDSICELFRSQGVRTMRVRLEPKDKDMKAFFEHMGFGSEVLVSYTKAL